MEKNSKIYVAGHKGLVGSAIWNNLQSKGYTNLIGKTSSELDLRDQKAVEDFFQLFGGVDQRLVAIVVAPQHVIARLFGGQVLHGNL